MNWSTVACGSEADALLKRIDQGSDLGQIRSDTACLLLKCLVEKRDNLDLWEKMNFEIAIALLSTAWLRLAVTHIKIALEPPKERTEVDAETASDLEAISYKRLIARITSGMP